MVVGNKNRGMARFESLLQMFGLEERLVLSYEDYHQREKSLLCPIDYEQVARALEEKRGEAAKFLQQALSE